MKLKVNQLVKKKTKIKRVIGKIYYILEINEEEIIKIEKEIKIIRRAIRNRKNKKNL